MPKSRLIGPLATMLLFCAGCASAPSQPVAIKCPPPPPMPEALKREPLPENFQQTIGSILRTLLGDAPTSGNETPPR